MVVKITDNSLKISYKTGFPLIIAEFFIILSTTPILHLFYGMSYNDIFYPILDGLLFFSHKSAILYASGLKRELLPFYSVIVILFLSIPKYFIILLFFNYRLFRQKNIFNKLNKNKYWNRAACFSAISPLIITTLLILTPYGYSTDDKFVNLIPSFSSTYLVKFIEKGANANAVSKREPRYTALMMAVIQKPELVKILLEHGADVNTVDQNGESALAKAVKINDAKLVELLIEYGADVNKFDNNGQRALLIAKRQKNQKIINLLLANGAKGMLLIQVGGPKMPGVGIISINPTRAKPKSD